MKKKRLPTKRCPVQGKRMFKHYQDAASVLRWAQKDQAAAATCPQSMYRCDECKHWHVTSYPPESTRRIQHAKKRATNPTPKDAG